MRYKQELTNKHYPLSSRIRLFESVVTPTTLYGCPAWTLTKELEFTLQRTQRKMLRMILGAGRRRLTQQTTPKEPTTDEEATATAALTQQENYNDDDADLSEDDGDVKSNLTQESAGQHSEPDEDMMEPWGDWIKRVTSQAEKQLERLNIETWVQTARKHKWSFVTKVTHMNHDRWTKKAAFGDPTITTTRAIRNEGHPRKRWLDDISAYLQQHSIHSSPWLHSRHVHEWKVLGHDFIHDMGQTKQQHQQ